MKMNTKDFKPLTREEIIDKLKDMSAEIEKKGPYKVISFLVLNDEYDPDNFSEEIENSEEHIDFWKLLNKEIHKPEFDFVWNNTLSRLPKNSERWQNNHTKNCYIKMLPFELYIQCVTHDDGTRDFISEEIVNKILKVQEKYKIIDFC